MGLPLLQAKQSYGGRLSPQPSITAACSHKRITHASPKLHCPPPIAPSLPPLPFLPRPPWVSLALPALSMPCQVRVAAGDPAARRYIISFKAELIEIQGRPWVRLVVVGQSFMLHQIRCVLQSHTAGPPTKHASILHATNARGQQLNYRLVTPVLVVHLGFAITAVFSG